MQQIQKSHFDRKDLAEARRDPSDGLPGGWWILPSAVLGFAGWVGIFHMIGIL